MIIEKYRGLAHWVAFAVGMTISGWSGVQAQEEGSLEPVPEAAAPAAQAPAQEPAPATVAEEVGGGSLTPTQAADTGGEATITPAVATTGSTAGEEGGSAERTKALEDSAGQTRDELASLEADFDERRASATTPEAREALEREYAEALTALTDRSNARDEGIRGRLAGADRAPATATDAAVVTPVVEKAQEPAAPNALTPEATLASFTPGEPGGPVVENAGGPSRGTGQPGALEEQRRKDQEAFRTEEARRKQAGEAPITYTDFLKQRSAETSPPTAGPGAGRFDQPAIAPETGPPPSASDVASASADARKAADAVTQAEKDKAAADRRLEEAKAANRWWNADRYSAGAERRAQEAADAAADRLKTATAEAATARTRAERLERRATPPVAAVPPAATSPAEVPPAVTAPRVPPADAPPATVPPTGPVARVPPATQPPTVAPPVVLPPAATAPVAPPRPVPLAWNRDNGREVLGSAIREARGPGGRLTEADATRLAARGQPIVRIRGTDARGQPETIYGVQVGTGRDMRVAIPGVGTRGGDLWQPDRLADAGVLRGPRQGQPGPQGIRTEPLVFTPRATAPVRTVPPAAMPAPVTRPQPAPAIAALPSPRAPAAPRVGAYVTDRRGDLWQYSGDGRWARVTSI